MYGDFTKDDKEYQATICSEAEEGNNDIVDPAASQPERGDLQGISTHGKNSPFGFLELMTAGKLILQPLRTLFCVLQRSLLALSSVNEAIFVQAKNSNGITVRTFPKFNLLRGRCTLLPFPSALTSLCALGPEKIILILVLVNGDQKKSV